MSFRMPKGLPTESRAVPSTFVTTPNTLAKFSRKGLFTKVEVEDFVKRSKTLTKEIEASCGASSCVAEGQEERDAGVGRGSKL